MYELAAKGRLSVVVKKPINSSAPGNALSFLITRRFIVVNDQLLEDQRLMLISSANISSAVVMILDEAE